MSEAERAAAGERGGAAIVDASKPGWQRGSADPAAARGSDALVAAARPGWQGEELRAGAAALLDPRPQAVLGVSEFPAAPAAAAPATAPGPAPVRAGLARPARGHERIREQRGLAGKALAQAVGLVDAPGGALSPEAVGLALDGAAALLGRERVREFVETWLSRLPAEPDDDDEDQGEAEGA